MPKTIAQPFQTPPSSPDDILETGLLNLWYLVLPSPEVTNRPVAVKRLDRNLVLWRDAAGQINAVEDYCPHRGAPLSLGYVCDGRITCAYHGLQLDGNGVIMATPPTPASPFVGKPAIRAYPCREFAGGIWAYFADDPGRAAPEPVFPEEISSEAWSSFLFTTTWKCNWQVALDNRVDPIHGSYLHDNTFTLAYGRKDAELKTKKTQNGFTTWRTNQRGVNIDWHEVTFIPGNTFWIRTEIPYPIKIGGGSFRINAHPTPIDRETTYVWFYRSSKVSGWERDLWRFLYRNRLEARNFQVVEQDRAVLEAIPVEARKREMLLQTDVAVARMRRMVREEAERQFRAIRSARPVAAE
jgi:phenylpropionate dioxygenase-like ring-hydroxylating dioxygenase large terminal subunit